MWCRKTNDRWMVPSKLRSLILRLWLLNKINLGDFKKGSPFINPIMLLLVAGEWIRLFSFSQLCSSPISVIVGDKSNQSTIRGSAQNKLQLELLKSSHLIGRMRSEYSNTQKEQGFTTPIQQNRRIKTVSQLFSFFLFYLTDRAIFTLPYHWLDF